MQPDVKLLRDTSFWDLQGVNDRTNSVCDASEGPGEDWERVKQAFISIQCHVKEPEGAHPPRQDVRNRVHPLIILVVTIVKRHRSR